MAGYLGNAPSAVPLTSADITDGIITSAKIADGTIVNADINASAGIVASKLTGISSQPFRNIVINGDMQIAQRNTSVASLSSGSTYNTIDRMMMQITSLGTWTQSQSTDVPTGQGFANSLKMDCTTANASPSASSYLLITQRIEGQNLQYLKKGTANALSLTLSFWVKSTKTGTFIVEIADQNNNRTIVQSYTVSASNTWEYKTVTFAGDTTGTFTNNNGASLDLSFWLGAGSNFTSGTLATSWQTTTNANRAVGQVNCADSTSNDWLITGVQLEAGTSATDFEFLPYDVSLARCQRYYIYNREGNNLDGATFFVGLNTNEAFGANSFPVFMRAVPTITIYRGDGTSGYAERYGGGSAVCSASLIAKSGFAKLSGSGTLVANYLYGATYEASAEL